MGAPIREYLSGEETDRAWNATLEGRYEDALRMWDHIVEHDLRIGWFNTNRGITRLLHGDREGALADFLASRERPGKPKTPVPFVGAALWLLDRRDAACEDWAYEIARRRSGEITHCDEAGGVKVPALLWWASAHADQRHWRELAEEELGERGRTRQCRDSLWPGPVVPFLLGRTSDGALLGAIPEPNALRGPWLCQAHFYMGAGRLDASDLPGYRAQLAEAFGQGRNGITVPEYHLARAELDRSGWE